MTDFKSLLQKLSLGQSLSRAEAEIAFGVLMEGEATPAQIGAFLMALRVRGETIDEIVGAVSVMRAKMTPIAAPADAIDCCGTGGDHSGSYNVSTAVAFVVAGCGVPVAKHGNRAASSRSGAADVLSALGVNLEADFPLLERSLREAGVCFLLAPRHHSAMRHVGPVRGDLGMRTIFNMIGPLSNPARVKRQLIGVADAKYLRLLAEALGQLGADTVWVVHGSDGLDELTLTGPSQIVAWSQGTIKEFTVTPDDAGLPRRDKAELTGGGPDENRDALLALLDGATGAYRDIVLLNAAACLVIAGRAADLRSGAVKAAQSIDSGAARRALDQMIAISHAKIAA